MFLILFAGLFMLISVTFFDNYVFKKPYPKTYFAQNPANLVTSENRTDNFGCTEENEDDPIECPLADEGDLVSFEQLASAE